MNDPVFAYAEKTGFNPTRLSAGNEMSGLAPSART